jgi:hypothetical protein
MCEPAILLLRHVGELAEQQIAEHERGSERDEE